MRLAHHLTAEEINDCRQIQPALIGLDIGDRASPHSIGSTRLEVAIEQVWRYRQVVLAVRGYDEFALPTGFDAVQALAISYEECLVEQRVQWHIQACDVHLFQESFFVFGQHAFDESPVFIG